MRRPYKPGIHLIVTLVVPVALAALMARAASATPVALDCADLPRRVCLTHDVELRKPANLRHNVPRLLRLLHSSHSRRSAGASI